MTQTLIKSPLQLPFSSVVGHRVFNLSS